MRLIDANTLVGKDGLFSKRGCPGNCQHCGLWSAEGCRVILEAPTVDAVEVVRCKDCQWFEPNESVMPQSGTCGYHEMVKMFWDFCSRGKVNGDV